MKNLNDKPYGSGYLRWTVLILTGISFMGFTMFSDYFNSLKDLLTTHLHFTSTDFGIFQSSYGFPNVFLGMTIIGGIAVDKLGIRISGMISAIIAFFGVMITAYGASDEFLNHGPPYVFFDSFLKGFPPSLKVMSLGFFFLGLGLESFNLIVTKITVRWFKENKLALALSLNISLARVGTAAAISAAPVLVSRLGFIGSINIAVLISTIGLLTYFIYLFIETKRIKFEKEEFKATPDIKKISKKNEDQFKWKDVKNLIKNPGFIYILLLCVTFYSAFIPFLKYAPDLLHNKFHFSDAKAGFYTSALPIGTIIFGPLFGYLVDKKGNAVNLMLFGSLFLILAFSTLAFTNYSPVISFLMLGASFSLVPAAMWPTVARISPMKTLGTAYGVIFFVQNFGLWLFAFLPGFILDKTNPTITPDIIASGKGYYDYTWTITMLLGLGILGLYFAYKLIKSNKKHQMGLNMPIQGNM